MRHSIFELKVQLVLIALRKHKGVKQSTISRLLNLDRTSYSRIENGKAGISFGRLQLIATEFGTTTEIISILAGAFEIDDFETMSIDEILNKFLNADIPNKEKIAFSLLDLVSIFSLIKRFCPKIVSLSKSSSTIKANMLKGASYAPESRSNC